MAVIKKVTLPSGDSYDVSTLSIPFGQVDDSSTSTVFTATIDGITELYDGVCVYLKNGVVTSASGWTLNINDLGAKPVYQSMAAAGRTTTVFNVAYTGLFIYNSSRVEGGCWDYFYGFNSDTTRLSGLTDTSISSPTNGQTLIYDASESRWVNGELASTDYVVTVTLTTENDTVTYSANKTYANILNAYTNGKTILLIYNDTIYALDSYDSTANKLYFTRTHGSNRVYTDTFTMSLSNVITHGSEELTTEQSMYKYPFITNIGYDNSILGNYGTTAVRSYVEGDLFWYGKHQLGRATASISAGDTLTLNTNYVVTSISAEFKRLPTIINSLISTALAEYDDGDVIAYGNVEEEES